MKSLQVVKEVSFSAAHRLFGYKGACKNIHGHTYKVQICLQRGLRMKEQRTSEGRVDSLGMVVDFKEIKQRVESWINENLDHRIILHELDRAMISALANLDVDMFVMNCNPTAENLAVLIKKRAEGWFFETNVFVIWVRVWETPTAYAEVS